jgi:hypothetical protein
VLIGFEGEVKVIDFGIAKAANRASKTQAGVLKGKFGYMSPEQVRGLPIDRRSDVFAVGVLLYEMLTGERLFIGESDFSTLEKVRNAEVIPPTAYNKKINKELEGFVLKALAREVEDRYQWASDLAEDLQPFMIEDRSIFSSKKLAAFIRETYASEIAIEQAKMEEYLKITAPVEERQDAPAEGTFIYEAKDDPATGSHPNAEKAAPPAAGQNMSNPDADEDEDQSTDPSLAVPRGADAEHGEDAPLAGELVSRTSLSAPPEMDTAAQTSRKSGGKQRLPNAAAQSPVPEGSGGRAPVPISGPAPGGPVLKLKPRPANATLEETRAPSISGPMRRPVRNGKQENRPEGKAEGKADSLAIRKEPPQKDGPRQEKPENGRPETQGDKAGGGRQTSKQGGDRSEGNRVTAKAADAGKGGAKSERGDISRLDGRPVRSETRDAAEAGKPEPRQRSSLEQTGEAMRVDPSAATQAMILAPKLRPVVKTDPGVLVEPPPATADEPKRPRAKDDAADIGKVKQAPVRSAPVTPDDQTENEHSLWDRLPLWRLLWAEPKVRIVLGAAATAMALVIGVTVALGPGRSSPGVGGLRLVAKDGQKPPAKLTIQVDDVPRADTIPVEISDLAPGAHKVKVEGPGLMSISEQVTVTSGQMREVEIELVPSDLATTLTDTPGRADCRKGDKKCLQQQKEREKKEREARETEKPPAAEKKDPTKGDEKKTDGPPPKDDRKTASPGKGAEEKKSEPEERRKDPDRDERKVDAPKRDDRPRDDRRDRDKEREKEKERAGATTGVLADLLLNTKPVTAQVFIDGKDLKMWTPISKAKGLKVPLGKHVIIFKTGDGKSYKYDVMIEPVENKLIVELGTVQVKGNVKARYLTE